MAEPWVSIDDVAAHLGVRKDSIYRWIEQRGLPAQKIGKLWKLKLSEVDEWVRARGAAADSPVRFPERTHPVQRTSSPERVVLVIDDERLVRDTVSEFLEDEGYSVLIASDGAEALKLLAAASSRPILIILDLKMPNIDGWGFREKQAADPNLDSIPVIAVTALPSVSISGAIVLRKPLYLDQLAAAMERVLKNEAERIGVQYDRTAVQEAGRQPRRGSPAARR